MENKNTIKLVSQIIFYGAVWGITEATLGYLLHFLPPTLAGLIMFPIAAFILMKSYRAIGKRSALIYVGLIAAAIKAVDFFIPGMMAFKIVNPMISIVMESLMVAAAYSLLSGNKATKRVLGSIGSSIGWRTGYVLYMAVQFIITGFVSNYIASASAVINFVILNGFLSGALVYGMIYIDSKTVAKPIKFRPVYALFALVLAIGLQFAF